jgi:hypothetical protein
VNSACDLYFRTGKLTTKDTEDTEKNSNTELCALRVLCGEFIVVEYQKTA